MKERFEDGITPPLPRSLLPEPQPSERDPAWTHKVARIVAAAGPELRRLEGRRSAPAVSGWRVMGIWWKPAAVLAAASIALLLLARRPAASRQPLAGSIPLGFVVSEGDPVTLWRALGIPADPVLALMAIREQGDTTGPGSPATIPQERNR